MAATEPIRLVTGWEPEVPVGDTVLRRFVHAWAESLAGPVAAVGGCVERRGGLMLGDLARPAAYYNGATLLRPPDPDAWRTVVGEIEEVLLAGPGGGDVYLWSAWPTPDLRRRGYWQALLRTRLADLKGLPSASLFSDMSRARPERNGFLPVTRFTLWRRARP
jgi:hypothetical protein